jgi:hypothetical protein
MTAMTDDNRRADDLPPGNVGNGDLVNGRKKIGTGT